LAIAASELELFTRAAELATEHGHVPYTVELSPEKIDRTGHALDPEFVHVILIASPADHRVAADPFWDEVRALRNQPPKRRRPKASPSS
jgi:hypothetical protein